MRQRFLIEFASWTWSFFFFFNDTATTEIYTLSLHDALPIYMWSNGSQRRRGRRDTRRRRGGSDGKCVISFFRRCLRSEEHTSELQSHLNLVCRLLLEKKTISFASLTGSFSFRARRRPRCIFS